MSRTWAWAASADLDPGVERNEVWTNPELPPGEARARRPLRVEISVVEHYQQTLNQIEIAFFGDSMLAAIMRRYDTCRFLVYSAASDTVAYERCRDIRDALRLTSMGCSVGLDPGWSSLDDLSDDTLPATEQPVGGSPGPGAGRG
jgi:hypothetical protein